MSTVVPFRNLTWVIVPSLSAALAVKLKVAGDAATVPVVGAVMLTVGAALDFKLIAAEVVVRAVLSVTLAVMV